MSAAQCPSARTRAGTVCLACHSRKVKCDLEAKLNNRCTPCEKRQQVCKPRRGIAAILKSRPTTNLHVATTTGSAAERVYSPTATRSLSQSADGVSSAEGATALDDSGRDDNLVTEEQVGYIGEQSLMAGPSPSNLVIQNPLRLTLLDKFNKRLLNACEALEPPSPVLLQAARDAYRTYIQCRIPVLEEADLTSSTLPILLQQTLCLVHSILRYPRVSSASATSDEYYAKVRTLLFVNYETDAITVLKALCLLHCWNRVPPDIITLDSSWSWSGIAMRYAFHLGLHQEATYSNFQNPYVARRIAWYLYTQDKVQTLCWSRPGMMSSAIFTTRPLELTDFARHDENTSFFIHFAKLLQILERVLDPGQDRAPNVTAYEIIQMFLAWINDLPLTISLFEGENRQPFSRCAYEIHILYFVGLIVFCHHFRNAIGSSAASAISLTGSSLAAQLYEELDCRDQVFYLLSIHNWCLMVSCIPQIGYKHTAYDEDQACEKDLAIMVAVLRQMTEKWPSAHRILALVQRSWHPESTPTQAFASTPEKTQQETFNTMFNPSGYELSDIPLLTLFPFPEAMIPRIEVLRRCKLGKHDVDVGEVPFDGHIDWVFDEIAYDNSDIFSFN